MMARHRSCVGSAGLRSRLRLKHRLLHGPDTEMADPHAVVPRLELGNPYRPFAQAHVGIEPHDAANGLTGPKRARNGHAAKVGPIDTHASWRYRGTTPAMANLAPSRQR